MALQWLKCLYKIATAISDLFLSKTLNTSIDNLLPVHRGKGFTFLTLLPCGKLIKKIVLLKIKLAFKKIAFLSSKISFLSLFLEPLLKYLIDLSVIKHFCPSLSWSPWCHRNDIWHNIVSCLFHQAKKGHASLWNNICHLIGHRDTCDVIYESHWDKYGNSSSSLSGSSDNISLFLSTTSIFSHVMWQSISVLLPDFWWNWKALHWVSIISILPTTRYSALPLVLRVQKLIWIDRLSGWCKAVFLKVCLHCTT